MDEMTQHNAALVEQTNAAIEQTEAQAADSTASWISSSSTAGRCRCNGPRRQNAGSGRKRTQ
jgi:hypothetical protein